MEEKIAEIPFLMNIGFLITYKCQISCPHCIVEAGPDRKEVMKTEDIFNWIDQIARYDNGKVKIISFTGGEPFYDIDAFRKMTEHVVLQGLVPTAVTNAFWAQSEEKAVEVLESFPALKFLSISTDEHHLRCIPLKRIKNAIAASKRLEIVYGVTISTENVNSDGYLDLLKKLEEFTDASKISTVTTFPVGRAEKLIDHSRYQMTHTIPVTSCGDAHTPVIFPDGNVYACIGPVITIRHDNPLLLGNLHETSMKDILDGAEKNTILHFIRTMGPKKLYDLLKERGFELNTDMELIDGSLCGFCHLLMNNKEMVKAMYDLGNNRELIEKTAYARKFYLQETEMLAAIGINTPA